jgi:23S rRNA (cytidine1920-2'-O)/16S rRNA (cytidine1409-2'-O)-methyltransferase
MRLDTYLFQKGMAKSRARAQSLIRDGHVMINQQVVAKTSAKVANDDVVSLLQEDHPYVSRGAFKLKAIFDALEHDVSGKNVIDIGSSTGGFCQIALGYGAEHVIAVDVGTNQLDDSLRELDSITVMEQTDARCVTGSMLPCLPDVLVSDVSFISQQIVLPHILNELKSVQQLYILVKPQFELTKAQIGKGGVVKNKKHQEEALKSVIKCLEDNGFVVKHTMDSPITGGDGNHEYMVYGERIGTGK